MRLVTDVTAIIVTRGDVDLLPIMETIPDAWEVLVWDNGLGVLRTFENEKWGIRADGLPDLSVYGRYRAIRYAAHPIIYVQDDDCVVSEPEQIAWESDSGGSAYGQLVCNMPHLFRGGEREEAVLVGFGAAFHRDLPAAAFERFGRGGIAPSVFKDQCDLVFTTLTPVLKTHVPIEVLDYAFAEDRMYRKPDRQKERRAVYDACVAIV
jgi:hypothetical protein